MTTARRAAAAIAAALLWIQAGACVGGQELPGGAAAAPCDESLPLALADQCVYYTDARSFAALRDHAGYPNFAHFIGFDRDSSLIGIAPTFVPLCSADGLPNLAALAERPEPRTASGATPDPSTAVAVRLKIAFNEFATLAYRLRACDYVLSVYAWNTRRSGHDAAFDYSWRKGCNSFAYERKLGEAFRGIAASADDPNSQFSLNYYRVYDDLFKHVQSCSAIASNTFYPVNTHRFFCNYAGFIGALITADAAAFGRRWGGSNSLTQSQITGLGTVLVATPSFCQIITPAKGSKAGG